MFTCYSKIRLIQICSFLLLLCYHSTAQVGIGTNDPKGALDITTNSNIGLVLPRVSDVESVTDGQGNPPVDGTTVFDLSRNATCYFQNSEWICITADSSGDPILLNVSSSQTTFNDASSIDYLKASNTGDNDKFGEMVSLSGDGNTLAVGAFSEDSNATGINGNQADNSNSSSGAVYIFNKTGAIWTQQAYIKASNSEAIDFFSESGLSLSNDGNTLAVGAEGEDSNATGINGNQTDNSISGSGAVYIFSRTGSVWTQQAYIKASNTGSGDLFGISLSLSNDGNTLAVGAENESSNATGINGDQADNSISGSGAVYIFSRTGSVWTQQVYIKASNTGNADKFGNGVSLSLDGHTLAVGAINEDSSATGINGDQTDNASFNSGAVYIFLRTGSIWTQQAYIKASNTGNFDGFGGSVDLSSDGSTLAIGAIREDSNATGVNGNETDNSLGSPGAAYIFVRTGTTWTQEAYIKASNTTANANFGNSISLSNDGSTLAVGASKEDTLSSGINSTETLNGQTDSGATYIYKRTGINWAQEAYIKANNSNANDEFGYSVSLSGDGNYLAVGARNEDSNATGINGDQANDLSINSGAVYIYTAN
ncbi:hypothetical protein [Nonlabens ulvanivorans]|uniref:hypothetical protein n=1 Tax=Nonlabens ulvanivorans TaxID=906888 RepID=UPI0029429782|nr:hypothetical protein [Nonlabens ulvanivorans]WOI22352.1 hypothetical protein R1T42_11830 [Nonlabens ulvanivorans]